MLLAALAVPAVSGTLAGCGNKPPDPLVALTVQARSDAALADAVAQMLRASPAGSPGQAGSPEAATSDMLAALAAARRAHADTMVAELGDDAPPPAPAGQPGPPPPEARTALAGVLTALDDAQRRAAAEVPGLPRHRAAVVGSIAACCAAYRAVLT